MLPLHKVWYGTWILTHTKDDAWPLLEMYEELKLTFSDFEANITPVCVLAVRKIVHGRTLRNAGSVLITVDVPMVLTGGGG
jgi:hypothetical protein